MTPQDFQTLSLTYWHALLVLAALAAYMAVVSWRARRRDDV